MWRNSERFAARRCGFADEVALGEAIAGWYAQSSGALLFEAEQRELEGLLGGCFGYYLVQIGALGTPTEPLGLGSQRSRVLLGPVPPTHDGVIPLCSELQRLPIASDSVDLVLLPHTLDFFGDPHRILREVERILIPEGRVIVYGFNPWSLWGVARLFRAGRGVPWCGRFLAPRRVEDWLGLLGFDVESSETLMFRPPFHSRWINRGLHRLEGAGQRLWSRFGGVYMIQAVKRVARPTPVGPVWRLRSVVLGGRMIEPTTRSNQRG